MSKICLIQVSQILKQFEKCSNVLVPPALQRLAACEWQSLRASIAALDFEECDNSMNHWVFPEALQDAGATSWICRPAVLAHTDIAYRSKIADTDRVAVIIFHLDGRTGDGDMTRLLKVFGEWFLGRCFAGSVRAAWASVSMTVCSR